jgi:hypothetical protein
MLLKPRVRDATLTKHWRHEISLGNRMRNTLPAVAMLTLALGAMASPTTAVAQTLVPCAREGGFCSVPYPTEVVYGFGRAVTSRFVRGGGIPCRNEFFGDPAFRVKKQCWFVARGRGGYGGFDDRPRRYDRWDRY